MGEIIGILFGILMVVIINILEPTICDKKLKIKVVVFVFVIAEMAGAFTVIIFSVALNLISRL